MIDTRVRDIEKYVSDINNGLIVLKEKPFRWTIDSVILLFDSVVKGYPIGYIIMNGNVVVDGYHRLLIISKYLTNEYDLYYNLETTRFTANNYGVHCVPISTLISFKKLYKYTKENSLTDKQIDIAEYIGTKILDYKICSIITTSEDEANTIILRNNPQYVLDI